MRLNDAVIASEKYRGEPTTDEEGRAHWPVCILWDDDLQGFGVRIHPPHRGRPSRKDFIVTWKVGLRTRTMAIGTFGAGCTLRQARKLAREALDLARRGQDPIEARHRALGIGTAEDLASRFLFEHKAAQKKPVPGGDSTVEPAADTPEPGQEEETGFGASVEADPVVAGAEIGGQPEGQAPSAGAAQDPPPGAAAEPVAPEVFPATEDRDSPPEAPSIFAEAPPVPADIPAPAASAAPVTPPTAAPAAPASTARAPEPPRRPLAPPTPPPKRGPTKVRLLPVPESLYRAIEHGARESSMTIAAYLNALIEIARAAVGEAPTARPKGGDGPSPEESGPSIRELFTQVQEAQAVQVGGSDPSDREPR